MLATPAKIRILPTERKIRFQRHTRLASQSVAVDTRAAPPALALAADWRTHVSRFSEQAWSLVDQARVKASALPRRIAHDTALILGGLGLTELPAHSKTGSVFSDPETFTTLLGAFGAGLCGAMAFKLLEWSGVISHDEGLAPITSHKYCELMLQKLYTNPYNPNVWNATKLELISNSIRNPQHLEKLEDIAQTLLNDPHKSHPWFTHNPLTNQQILINCLWVLNQIDALDGGHRFADALIKHLPVWLSQDDKPMRKHVLRLLSTLDELDHELEPEDRRRIFHTFRETNQFLAGTAP